MLLAKKISSRNFSLNRMLRTLILPALALGACAESQTFPEIGTNLSGPIDIEVSPDGSTFYVLNSDPSRDYSQGSILLMDQDRNKTKAIPIRRLANSLEVIDNYLFVHFERQTKDSGDPDGRLQIYDISNPQEPQLKAEFLTADCSPIASVGSTTYGRFFTSCKGGPIYTGNMTDFSQMELFREPDNYTRKALHLDTVNQRLFAFVTDLGEPNYEDLPLIDEFSYDDAFNQIEGPNQVADIWEKSRTFNRRFASLKPRYQFLIVDLKKAAEANFKQPEKTDPILDQEKHYLYFNLKGLEGELDRRIRNDRPPEKYYRTNIWEVQADPVESNIFYFTHRGLAGSGSSPHANQIVKATVLKDPYTNVKKTVNNSEVEVLPTTEEFMSFERVYGFAGIQNQKGSYPASFKLLELGGQQVFIVNHFRNLVDFEDPHFRLSLAPRTNIQGSPWYQQVVSTDPNESYNSFAINQNGRILATSFYGNRIHAFDISVESGFTKIQK